MDINNIMELNHLASEEGVRFQKKRSQFDEISNLVGRHFVGIVGPRGVGKTVLLKQFASSVPNSFYLSVDTLSADDDLFALAKVLAEKYQISNLLLDEIHFKKNFEAELKKIFDFLKIRVVFTSSVALAMVTSSFDLSRRIQLVPLPPFSYREYLFFKMGQKLSKLSWEDLIEKKWSNDHLRMGFEFDHYLKGGLYPFTLEEPEPKPLFASILQKIIQKDIPSVVRLHTEELSLIEKLVRFVGRSSVDGINYSSLSQNIGITKYKAEQYVDLLQKSFVLTAVVPEGANVLMEPKILMALPYRLLYDDYDRVVGGLREDFFAQTMAVAQWPFKYLKSLRGAKTPDFLVKTPQGNVIIEVGGKGKGREQFKGITNELKIRLVHSDDFEGDKRPLF